MRLAISRLQLVSVYAEHRFGIDFNAAPRRFFGAFYTAGGFDPLAEGRPHPELAISMLAASERRLARGAFNESPE